MNINVYFLDKTVSFCTEMARGEHFDAVIVADDAVTRAKVLKILETCNRVAVLTPQPKALFDSFAGDFKNVEAAGGVVTNSKGEMLMMFRRGRWDLPKGHLEPAESVRQCARREVAEETGISKTRVTATLCTTYHIYDLYGEWELKRTHWFAMVYEGREKAVPQKEEGIERVEWVPARQVAERLRESYPTIREVYAAFLQSGSKK